MQSWNSPHIILAGPIVRSPVHVQEFLTQLYHPAREADEDLTKRKCVIIGQGEPEEALLNIIMRPDLQDFVTYIRSTSSMSMDFEAAGASEACAIFLLSDPGLHHPAKASGALSAEAAAEWKYTEQAVENDKAVTLMAFFALSSVPNAKIYLSLTQKEALPLFLSVEDERKRNEAEALARGSQAERPLQMIRAIVEEEEAARVLAMGAFIPGFPALAECLSTSCSGDSSKYAPGEWRKLYDRSTSSRLISIPAPACFDGHTFTDLASALRSEFKGDAVLWGAYTCSEDRDGDVGNPHVDTENSAAFSHLLAHFKEPTTHQFNETWRYQVRQALGAKFCTPGSMRPPKKSHLIFNPGPDFIVRAQQLIVIHVAAGLLISDIFNFPFPNLKLPKAVQAGQTVHYGFPAKYADSHVTWGSNLRVLHFDESKEGVHDGLRLFYDQVKLCAEDVSRASALADREGSREAKALRAHAIADHTVALNELDLAREVETRSVRPLLKAYNCAAHLLVALSNPPLAYAPQPAQGGFPRIVLARSLSSAEDTREVGQSFPILRVKDLQEAYGIVMKTAISKRFLRKTEPPLKLEEHRAAFQELFGHYVPRRPGTATYFNPPGAAGLGPTSEAEAAAVAEAAAAAAVAHTSAAAIENGMRAPPAALPHPDLSATISDSLGPQGLERISGPLLSSARAIEVAPLPWLGMCMTCKVECAGRCRRLTGDSFPSDPHDIKRRGGNTTGRVMWDHLRQHLVNVKEMRQRSPLHLQEFSTARMEAKKQPAVRDHADSADAAACASPARGHANHPAGKDSFQTSNLPQWMLDNLVRKDLRTDFGEHGPPYGHVLIATYSITEALGLMPILHAPHLLGTSLHKHVVILVPKVELQTLAFPNLTVDNQVDLINGSISIMQGLPTRTQDLLNASISTASYLIIVPELGSNPATLQASREEKNILFPTQQRCDQGMPVDTCAIFQYLEVEKALVGVHLLHSFRVSISMCCRSSIDLLDIRRTNHLKAIAEAMGRARDQGALDDLDEGDDEGAGGNAVGGDSSGYGGEAGGTGAGARGVPAGYSAQDPFKAPVGEEYDPEAGPWLHEQQRYEEALSKAQAQQYYVPTPILFRGMPVIGGDLFTEATEETQFMSKMVGQLKKVTGKAGDALAASPQILPRISRRTHPSFLAGGFVGLRSSVVSNLVQSFNNPVSVAVMDELLNGSPGFGSRMIAEPLPPAFNGRTWKYLLKVLMAEKYRGAQAVGLYRARGTFDAPMDFVCLLPPNDTKLCSTDAGHDIVYMLAQEPVWLQPVCTDPKLRGAPGFGCPSELSPLQEAAYRTSSAARTLGSTGWGKQVVQERREKDAAAADSTAGPLHVSPRLNAMRDHAPVTFGGKGLPVGAGGGVRGVGRGPASGKGAASLPAASPGSAMPALSLAGQGQVGAAQMAAMGAKGRGGSSRVGGGMAPYESDSLNDLVQHRTSAPAGGVGKSPSPLPSQHQQLLLQQQQQHQQQLFQQRQQLVQQQQQQQQEQLRQQLKQLGISEPAQPASHASSQRSVQSPGGASGGPALSPAEHLSAVVGRRGRALQQASASHRHASASSGEETGDGVESEGSGSRRRGRSSRGSARGSSAPPPAALASSSSGNGSERRRSVSSGRSAGGASTAGSPSSVASSLGVRPPQQRAPRERSAQHGGSGSGSGSASASWSAAASPASPGGGGVDPRLPAPVPGRYVGAEGGSALAHLAQAAPRSRGASPTDRTTSPQAEARGRGGGQPSHNAAAQKVKAKMSAQKAFARSLKG